jgi:mannose-6-phosphate isomerase-like protein (cupin superfamily)
MTSGQPAHAHFQARRVVAGLNAEGRSTITADEFTTTRSFMPGWTLCDVWQADSLPPRLDDDHTLQPGERQPYSAVGGLVWRVGMFPPDTAWTPPPPEAPGEPPAMHTNHSVDVITIVSGEIYVVLEDGETLLRPGDTFVQRGTRHAWSNRSDQPCVLVAAMAAVDRS